MNIAISSIAWDHSEDDIIAGILQKYRIQGIEIAPTKIWEDPTNVSKQDAKAYKNYWESKGISIIAMQSLLFGHPELTIFETQEQRRSLISYLQKIITLASTLGVKAMVFGSPKNRIRGNISEKIATDIACDFFSRIGDIAKQHDIHFCIEANPKAYGTDFLNTTSEVVEFIKLVEHPYINVHIDSGAMQMNNENIEESILIAHPFLHFHISEPNLLPVPQDVDHTTIVKTLNKIHYDKWVSVEMRPVNEGNNSEQIENTLRFVTQIYRNEN